jgi:carboxymethylenebutenolidase
MSNFRGLISRRKGFAWIHALMCTCLSLLLLGSTAPAATQPASAQENNAAGVSTETVQYESGGVRFSAFVAKPTGEGKHAAVIVIHDNQGLTDAIRDAVRQFAAAGFLAIAPDLVSRAGGTKSPQQAQGALAKIPPDQTVEDLRGCFAFLQTYPGVDPARISSVGYGWGGWRSFRLASTVSDLYRAVVFYGATPTDGLQNIHAPVLANYAQYDFFDTGNSIWTENTMKDSGKKFTYYVYPKTFRAFANAGSPRYDAEAAKLAWARTLDFLQSP